MKILKKIMIICIIAFIVLFIRNILVKQYMFPIKHKSYIMQYSSEYKLDPLLVLAIIKTESNFNENAISKKNAMGLMQVTKPTGAWVAEQLNVYDFKDEALLNPNINIQFGCWYLNNLNEEFKDLDLVLAAYNGGRGNVRKWLASKDYSHDGKILYNIPFKETDKYVKKVNLYYNVYKALYGEKEFTKVK